MIGQPGFQGCNANLLILHNRRGHSNAVPERPGRLIKFTGIGCDIHMAHMIAVIAVDRAAARDIINQLLSFRRLLRSCTGQFCQALATGPVYLVQFFQG